MINKISGLSAMLFLGMGLVFHPASAQDLGLPGDLSALGSSVVDGQDNQYCLPNSRASSYNIKVVQEIYQEQHGDIYITCNWYSENFTADVGETLGFWVTCPADSDIITPGYLLGGGSLLKVDVVASIGVPKTNGIDEGQTAIVVSERNSTFQILTFTLCRPK